MTAADTIIAHTRDARLSPYAMSAIPAWLWAADATRVIWANATGAAVLKAPSPAALSERIFEGQEELAADIARVSAALPVSGAPRLERLRGIGSNLVCTCSRLTLADGYGILVVGSEPARPPLPLNERASRLFAASSEPLAVFSAEGALLYATGDLDADTTLATLGADALKTQALSTGRASGTSALGTLALEKIGNGATTVLLATLPDVRESAEERPEQVSEQAEQVETPQAEPAPPADIPAPPVSTDIPAPERRAPLRFVWTMDAAQRFNVATVAFGEQMGARTRDALGKPWSEIAQTLGIDSENRVANAVASRDTWSGVTIAWPAETGERVTVELSGLPIFDRERSFQGYRGFGVCRDGARAAAAPPVQATPPAPLAQPEPPKEEPRPLLTVVPAAKNVVPFRGGAPSEKRPSLTPVERSAFNEIAEALAKGEAPPITPEPEAKQAEPEKPAPPALPGTLPSAFAPAVEVPVLRSHEAEYAILERLPVGVLIHRNENLIYANRAFLEWTGYADLAAVTAAGGLERLVVDPSAGALDRNGTGKTFTIATRTGDTLICEGRLYSVPWNGESALMLVLVRTAAADRLRDSEIALRAVEAESARTALHPRHRNRRRDRGRPRRLGAHLQPLGGGTVRLRVSRDGAPAVHRAVRAGERARRARLSRWAHEERRRERAQ